MLSNRCKANIDKLSYREMVRLTMLAPLGHRYFQFTEIGCYFSRHFKAEHDRIGDEAATEIAQSLGWY